MLLLFAALCLLQADIQVYIDDADCVFAHPKYVSYCDVGVDYVNETTNAIHVDFELIEDSPRGTMANFEVLLDIGGDNFVSTGMQMEMPLKDMAAEPIGAGPLMNCLSCTNDEPTCKKGKHTCNDYFPSADELPSSLPNGRYKAMIRLYEGEEMFLKAITFAQVQTEF
ncbi:uncharacterized protein LOC105702409 isoform X2 [Orussus abietinus]|uniref:uncharacterized protein LOC105702409 isoform X2 n=1 Tax=Orussus abietinus TaxID=222816 RepID=UPI000625CADE|nr:uncharacterized protein LOC105702409 isoform X2 [Orussus abietinus]